MWTAGIPLVGGDVVAMETSLGGVTEEPAVAISELARGMRGGLVESCIGGCYRDT